MNKKRSIYGAALLGMASCAWSAEVAVQLKEAPAAGTLALALFDSPNAFGNFHAPVKTARFTLDGRAEYRIENVPPGEYALLIYYDQNNNGRIDKNFIGIPNEPLAFSNHYRPKGPASFQRAAFNVLADDTARFEVELTKPLGERGRIGVGLGMIGRSSPYRDYDGGIYQFLPSIVYTGSRLQIYGPAAQFGLVGSGKLRIAAKGHYRMGVYQEDQSDYLTGMGDAEATFMAGLSVQSELPGGLNLSAAYLHDALNRIGGGEARIGLAKSFQFGVLRLTPQASVNWMAADLSNNDFGVPTTDARPDRPAYTLGSTLSYEAGATLFWEIASDWILLLNSSIELLDDEATRSPIVSDDVVLKSFCALSYIF